MQSRQRDQNSHPTSPLHARNATAPNHASRANRRSIRMTRGRSGPTPSATHRKSSVRSDSLLNSRGDHDLGANGRGTSPSHRKSPVFSIKLGEFEYARSVRSHLTFTVNALEFGGVEYLSELIRSVRSDVSFNQRDFVLISKSRSNAAPDKAAWRTSSQSACLS